jgi:glycosyltransferase involved in cell wall biosynthesis
MTIIKRKVLKKFLNVAIVSNSMSGWENEKYTYFSENLIIPNWFDSNRFRPCDPITRAQVRDNLGYKEGIFVLVSVGGNWGYKNYDLIIKALDLIPNKYDILYVQVGPQGEGQPLQELANRLGVTSRLHCTGKVPDPLKYLHAADAFIMPSSIEGFGCAAAEAMGVGIPCILSHVPALKDFRETCPEVIYIDPNPSSIAKAVVEIYSQSPVNRSTIGRELSKRAHANYGIENGAGEYVKLYNAMLAGKRYQQ